MRVFTRRSIQFCRFTSRITLEEIANNKTVDGQRIVDEAVGGSLTIIYSHATI